MALEALRPWWWIPCLLVMGYSLLSEGSRTAATAVIGPEPPAKRNRAPAPEALERVHGKVRGAVLKTAVTAPGVKRSAADDVIPLLLDWKGKAPAKSAEAGLKRNLFTYERDVFKEHEDRLRAEDDRRKQGWQAQGATLAQAALRQATLFSCELRYGGDCPLPPPPPPVAPRFAYELVGVFTQNTKKQAAFIDPATRTIVMAKQGEKIGDTPFRVRKFNLTSVEVGADGFTDSEKIPMSKKGDESSGSNSL